MMVIEMKQL